VYPVDTYTPLARVFWPTASQNVAIEWLGSRWSRLPGPMFEVYDREIECNELRTMNRKQSSDTWCLISQGQQGKVIFELQNGRCRVRVGGALSRNNSRSRCITMSCLSWESMRMRSFLFATRRGEFATPFPRRCQLLVVCIKVITLRYPRNRTETATVYQRALDCDQALILPMWRSYGGVQGVLFVLFV
jgi:hypothetical protein